MREGYAPHYIEKQLPLPEKSGRSTSSLRLECLMERDAPLRYGPVERKRKKNLLRHALCNKPLRISESELPVVLRMPDKTAPFRSKGLKPFEAFPIPCRCSSGKTDTGPSPNQAVLPSEMVTGENAICPATRPSSSATRDTARASAARSASITNCSRWLLIARVLNAAIVTSVITRASSFVSFLITII